jgi:hypothetical protein
MTMGLKRAAIIGAIVFMLIYSVSAILVYEQQNGEGSIDKRCSTYVVDSVQGSLQTGHYENRNELCYFYWQYLFIIPFIIAMFPVMLMVGVINLDRTVSPSLILTETIIGVIINLIIYGAIGSGIGMLFSKIFNRKDKNSS